MCVDNIYLLHRPTALICYDETERNEPQLERPRPDHVDCEHLNEGSEACEGVPDMAQGHVPRGEVNTNKARRARSQAYADSTNKGHRASFPELALPGGHIAPPGACAARLASCLIESAP